MKKFAATIICLGLMSGCNEATGEVEPVVESAPTAIEPVKKDENKNMQKKVEVVVTVPDSTWSMKVTDVIETDSEVAVIAQLEQAEGMMGMMVISEVLDAVEFSSDKPVKVYVLGKKWNWENKEAYEFVDKAPQGRSIPFSKVKTSHNGGPKKTIIGDEL